MEWQPIEEKEISELVTIQIIQMATSKRYTIFPTCEFVDKEENDSEMRKDQRLPEVRWYL